MNKLEKLLRIAQKPALIQALSRGTAASMEHVRALKDLTVATCLDVGANRGQFSVLCQTLFPGVRIFAFEPLAEAQAQCRRVLGPDVEIHGVALAASDSQAHFYVTSKTDSSSLLEPGDGQRDAYGVELASGQQVEVRRMDHILSPEQIVRPAIMKIDVQGAELEVLRGCGALLDSLDYIYLEGSFVELYKGQALITEIVMFLGEHGFALRGVYNNSYTSVLGDTQADFLFSRTA